MFKSQLCLRALIPDYWVVCEPLVWVDRGCTITVPKGFITDMASIPAPLRGMFDVDGLSRRPACLHDWLYAGFRYMGKTYADNTLRAALLCEGMNAPSALAYYLAVHWFGSRAYKNDGLRHPFSDKPANLTASDFETFEDFQTWVDTNPNPNG